MILISKFYRFRLILISVVLAMLFVWSAVPLALEIHGFIYGVPIFSPNEVTEMVQVLYIFFAPFLMSILLYGVWFSYSSRKMFWVLVIEKFIFHICIYSLAVSSVALYRNNFTQSDFNLNWEFIGFSVVSFFVIFQWSLQSIKKQISD